MVNDRSQPSGKPYPDFNHFTMEAYMESHDIPIIPGRPTEVDLQQARAVKAHVASDDPENDPEVAEAFRLARIAATQDALQAERDEADAAASEEARPFAPAGTQAGGPKAVPAEDVPEDLPQVNFNDLSDQEKFDVIQEAIAHLLGKTQQLEHHLQILGRTLMRILEKAGEIEVPEESGIVVPDGIVVPGRGRMDVPK